MKPRALIFSGYGLNCEEETQFAFRLAGGASDIIHINDLIDNKKKMREYQILAFPGGFSYGDDTGSGNAYAQKIKNHLWPEIEKILTQDKLIIGICNGCQILVNLGLVPGIGKKYGEKQVAFLHNDSARYIDRWVDLKVTSTSPWLKNIESLRAPIAHGEGRLFADKKTLKLLKSKELIPLTYVKGEMCSYQNLSANPTGTLENIAGLTDPTGKILAMMPHPERALFFTQRPDWPYLAEKLRREGKKLPVYNSGLTIFQNAITYFS
ncbi:MAG: phosphoribosylformylglycinamidine synthase subunit PurQ [Bacteroidia bacterium]